MSFDPRTFRNALGCFPTGVTIVTTLGGDSLPVGVTVSSFTSVSLSPPLVLFCLDDRNSGLEAFRRCSHFSINVLSEEQRELSHRFSSRKTSGLLAWRLCGADVYGGVEPNKKIHYLKLKA